MRALDIRIQHDEIVVDNFAGGGGASTGIEAALNRPPLGGSMNSLEISAALAPLELVDAVRTKMRETRHRSYRAPGRAIHTHALSRILAMYVAIGPKGSAEAIERVSNELRESIRQMNALAAS